MVYEEIIGIIETSSSRRVDIIALNRNTNFTIDPTVWFEINQSHIWHQLVNRISIEDWTKKINIYLTTTTYFKDYYDFKSFEVIGWFIGTQGKLLKSFVDFLTKFNLCQKKHYSATWIVCKVGARICSQHTLQIKTLLTYRQV